MVRRNARTGLVLPPNGAPAGMSIERRALIRGYVDARAQRPPLADYADSSNRDLAWNYEMGRYWVAMIRGAGLEPPEWDENDPAPSKVREIYDLAFNRAPHLMPLEEHQLPPDPTLDFRTTLPGRATRRRRYRA